MKPSDRQQRAGNRVRSALGLVLVAVLNLAFQPCAMAMDMDADHGCPHCPPGAEHANHDGKQNLDEIADCDYVSTCSLDSRPDKSQPKDPSPDAFAPMAAGFSLSGVLSPQRNFHGGVRTDRHCGDPPLNILYCVYLK